MSLSIVTISIRISRLSLIVSINLVLVLFSNLSSGSNTLHDSLNYPFGPSVELFIDSSETLTFKEVRDQGRFQAVDHLNLSFVKGVIWVKVRLSNHSKTSDLVLTSDDNLNRTYELFEPQENGVTSKRITQSLFGDSRTFDFPIPNFHIRLNSGAEAIYYLRSVSDGRVVEGTIHIHTLESFSSQMVNTSVKSGLFYGGAVLIFLFSVFLFVITRRNIFILYSVYVLFTIFSYLGLEGILFGFISNQYIAGQFLHFSILVLILFSLLFINKLLNVRENSMWLYKVIKYYQIFVLGGLFLYQILFYSVSLANLHLITSFNGFIWVILNLLLVFSANKTNALEKKYFVFAILVFTVFMFFGLLSSYKVFPYGHLIDYLKIGTLIELCIFTYAIAVIYKQKEERRLINLEKINEIQGFLDDQIQSKISMIDERNELIDSLKKEVNQIQKKPSFNKEDLVSILKLVELNIHSDVEWALFRKRYEELNPTFFGALLQDYPELSKSEIRLSLLIKLSMTSKEVAVVLNISPEGV